MRTYPSGIRVNSSNLDPSFFWRQGIQIVALNWQHCDKGMMLNKGMFAGSHGWVLKPLEYRGKDPASKLPEAAPSQEAQTTSATPDEKKNPEVIPPSRRTLHLSIEIYAGQSIPLPKSDSHDRSFRPYVSCQLHVERPKDSIHAPAKDSDSNDGSVKYKTKTKSCSGVDPDFGGQMLQFPSAPGVLEELSFVRSVKSTMFARTHSASLFLQNHASRTLVSSPISYNLRSTPGICSYNALRPAWSLRFLLKKGSLQWQTMPRQRLVLVSERYVASGLFTRHTFPESAPSNPCFLQVCYARLCFDFASFFPPRLRDADWVTPADSK